MCDIPFRYRKRIQKFYELTGQPKGVISPILPFRSRLKLLANSRIDKLAFWLVEKELYAAAGFVWRIPNAWK